MATDEPRRESIPNGNSSSDSDNEKNVVQKGAVEKGPVPGMNMNANPFNSEREDGKREITPAECKGQLGYDYPEWKKWMILSVIFTVQVSMVSLVYRSAVSRRGADYRDRTSTPLFTPTTSKILSTNSVSALRRQDAVR